jgi:hypothetical protein
MRPLMSLNILCHVLGGKGNGVLGHDRLTGGCMSCDEHTISHLEMIHGFLLEIVQLERILNSQRDASYRSDGTYLSGLLGDQFFELRVSLCAGITSSRRTLLILWLTSTT